MFNIFHNIATNFIGFSKYFDTIIGNSLLILLEKGYEKNLPIIFFSFIF